MRQPLAILLAASLLLAAGLADADAARPRIAIIIDDLGYRGPDSERAIALPGPVTVAVLPGTPRAAHLARLADRAGKEVILHLPLQPARAEDATDPGTLHLDMSREELQRTFRRHLAELPFASGVNGHRGSLLTRHPGHMAWLMAEIRRQPSLYFVDSYTTARSVALDVAREYGIPALKRDVFLDPDAEPGTLEREFERLKAIATAEGQAVGIGHPHASTLAFLERALPALADAGFELAPVSALLGIPAGPETGRDRMSGE